MRCLPGWRGPGIRCGVSGRTYVTRRLEQRARSWRSLIKEITSSRLGLGPNQAWRWWVGWGGGWIKGQLWL